MEIAGLGRPGTNPRAGARTIQVDGTTGSDFVAPAVNGKMFFVSAPTEFGRLCSFADEPVHRPGVDELVRLLGHVGYLGVALGDVDHLDAERLRELRPILASGGLAGSHVRV